MFLNAFIRKVTLVKIKTLVIMLPFFAGCFIFLSSKNDEVVYSLPENVEVLYVVEIFRHGARTPIHTLEGVRYPKLWSAQNIPNKELTFNGFFQMQRLGLNARDFFIKYSVFPSSHELKKIYIRTSGANRTIMSAAAYLSGLFGSDKLKFPSYQPFNINSIPLREDDVLRQNNKSPDRRYKDAIGWKKYWYEVAHEDYKRFYWINQNFFPESYKDRCLNAVDISPDDAYYCLKKIFDLANNVVSMEAYCESASGHESLLEMTGLNDEDVLKVKKHYNWIQTRSRVVYSEPQDYEFEKYLDSYKFNAKNVASKLMSEIISRFEYVKVNYDLPKISIYSSHDITISNFLSYIINFNLSQYVNQLPYNEYPGYGANIRVIFYKQKGEVYVALLYYPDVFTSKPDVLYGTVRKSIIFGQPYHKFKQTYSGLG